MSAQKHSCLKIFVLGPMRLQVGDRDLTLPYVPLRRLMIYLAVERRRVPRDALARLLWPGKPQDLALASLRQALHQLRKALGDCADLLESSRSEVFLAGGGRLWIDLAALASHVECDCPAEAIQAIELCRRPFLDEEADPGERWAAWKRGWQERIDEWLDTAYGLVVADLERRGAWDQAMRRGHDWRKQRPLADAPCLTLMRLLVQDGRRAEALSLYRLHSQNLAEQAGSRPGRILQTAGETLLHQGSPHTPEPSGMTAAKGLVHQISSRQVLVTVLAIVLNHPREEITLSRIEQHLERCLGLARELASRMQGRLVVGPDGGLEVRFGEQEGREDAPWRALRAGLELRQMLPQDSSTGIGLHCGHMLVDFQQEVVIGTASQIARALAWHNASGTGLMISRAAWHLLVDTEPPLPEQNAGRVAVYGQDVPLYWIDSLPPRSAIPQISHLVGRQLELEHLRSALATLPQSGTGGVVWLLGEAGMGKSCLLRAACAQAAGQLSVVMYRCRPEHQDGILHPVAERVRNLFQLHGCDRGQALKRLHSGLRRLGERDPEIVRIWSRWLGLESGADHELQAAIPQEVLYESLLDVMPRQFANEPRILAIEDVHWADSSTLELLRRFLQRVEQLPVLVLITSRFPMPLLRDVSRRQKEIVLLPLAEHEAQDMIRMIHPAIEAEAEKLVLRKARGNPLFIESMLRFLSGKDGTLPPLHGAESVPDNLQLLLGARVSQAGYYLDVLQAASVLGESFTLAALRSVASVDDLRLGQATAHLQGTGLVRRELPDHWNFAHALFRDAVYAGIPQARRLILHARAADYLLNDTIGLDPTELAWHLTQAGRLDDAMSCWMQAARHANALAAKRQALHHYLQAQSLLGQMDPAARQLWELESLHGIYLSQRALHGYSAPATAEALAALADACEQYRDKGLYRLSVLHGRWAMASVRVNTGHALEEARTMAAASLDQVSPQTHAGVADFVLGWCYFWRGDLSEASRHFRQAVRSWNEDLAQESLRALGQRYGDNALAYLALLEVMQGRPRAQVQQSLLHARQSARSWPDALAFLLSMEASIHYWWRDAQGARQSAMALSALSSRWNLGLWGIFANAVEAWSRAQTDPCDPAPIHELGQCMDRIERAWRFGAGFVALLQADALVARGKDAGSALARGLRHIRGMDIRVLMPEWQYLAGCHYQGQGQMANAERRYRRALMLGLRFSPLSAARAARALMRLSSKRPDWLPELEAFLFSLRQAGVGEEMVFRLSLHEAVRNDCTINAGDDGAHPGNGRARG